MKTFQKLLSWIREKDGLFFLIFLILVIFVFSPLLAQSKRYSILMQIVFSFLLISGVGSLPENRTLKIGTWFLLVTTLVGRWASEIFRESGTIFLAETVLTLAFLLLMIAVVLYQVFHPGRLNKARIEFAVSGYLLAGLLWAQIYVLIEKLAPGAILAAGVTIDPADTHTFIYYSLVTLTTVGYGDVTAILPLARTMALAEAMVGQLYPVILLGRLVSLPHDN